MTTSYDSAGFATSSSDGTTYQVDPAGELTQTQKGSSTTNYGYDTWGRMTSGAGASYVYDALDRTVSATAGSSTTSYAYSGNTGALASATAGSTTTTYAYAPGGTLAQKAGTTTRYLLSNSHDDVVALANKSTGAVVGTAAYDPWGVVRGITGETSLLGFQGDPTDPSTGLVDLGTRYYAPSLGRFTTRDSVFGSPASPMSINQFTYGAGNPVSSIDPNGMCSDPSMCPPPPGATHHVREVWLRLADEAANRYTYNNSYYGVLASYYTYTPPPPPPPPRPKPKTYQQAMYGHCFLRMGCYVNTTLVQDLEIIGGLATGGVLYGVAAAGCVAGGCLAIAAAATIRANSLFYEGSDGDPAAIARTESGATVAAEDYGPSETARALANLQNLEQRYEEDRTLTSLSEAPETSRLSIPARVGIAGTAGAVIACSIDPHCRERIYP